jgi:hypothetical protein
MRQWYARARERAAALRHFSILQLTLSYSALQSKVEMPQ